MVEAQGEKTSQVDVLWCLKEPLSKCGEETVLNRSMLEELVEAVGEEGKIENVKAVASLIVWWGIHEVFQKKKEKGEVLNMRIDPEGDKGATWKAVQEVNRLGPVLMKKLASQEEGKLRWGFQGYVFIQYTEAERMEVEGVIREKIIEIQRNRGDVV